MGAASAGVDWDRFLNALPKLGFGMHLVGCLTASSDRSSSAHWSVKGALSLPPDIDGTVINEQSNKKTLESSEL